MYSNIIFSNGRFDPWRAGGLTEFVNLHLPLYTIKNGAHHLDLREPTKVDEGTDVEFVRDQETMIISEWIENYNRRQRTYTKDPKVALYQF